MALEKSSDNITRAQIFSMQDSDVDEVVALDEKCFASPWSSGSYITEIHNRSAYYVVAKIDDKVVGYAGAWLIMDEAHITTIGVDPEYRMHGVGEQLFADLLREAVSRGVERATLEVRRFNHAAQSLYRKYGFQTVAIRKSYYTDNNEDALIMWVNDMRDPGFLHMLAKNEKLLGESV